MLVLIKNLSVIKNNMARQQYITKKASKGGIKKFGHNAQAAKVAPWP